MNRIVTALRAGRGISSFAACVLAFMVLVILQGAVVRATGSGAGCGNHWPLCNGDFIPHHPRVATIIEFMHRSLTGICTTLVAALIVWTFLARSPGNAARRAVVWCGILLITEALLGALLVKGGYVEHNASAARVFVQGIHFTNTMMLLAALTLTWWWLRPRPNSNLTFPRSASWIALATAVVAGATGSVAALADTLFPASSLQAALAMDFAANAPLLIRVRWIHPASAFIATAATLWLFIKHRSTAARWAMALAGLQIILGAADVILLAPTWIQVLHLLVADLYWISLVSACSYLLKRETSLSTY